MPKNYNERSLIEFQKAFPDNEACAKHLAEQRWQKRFVCPKCGHDEAWYLSKRKLFDCKNCRFQTSVTAATIFHGTRTIEHFLERLGCGPTTKEGQDFMEAILWKNGKRYGYVPLQSCPSRSKRGRKAASMG